MGRRYFKKHLADSQIGELQRHIEGSDYWTPIELGKTETHDCAVVFFDLCNFTNISWSLSKSDIMVILQTFFEFTSKNVTHHHGMIDKYPGDGVVAFFPRYFGEPDDVITEYALDCVTEVMFWFYEHMRWRFKLPKPSHSLELSVGVDAGSVSIAHVGSVYHSELILLGDVVNCASKCQEVAESREVVVGQDAANRVRSIYSDYFSTGPSTNIVYTSDNRRYVSYRFDWEKFAKASSWIRKT